MSGETELHSCHNFDKGSMFALRMSMKSLRIDIGQDPMLSEINRPCKGQFDQISTFRWVLQNIPGILETSPGVRSCMIEYDQRKLALKDLLIKLLQAEKVLPTVSRDLPLT